MLGRNLRVLSSSIPVLGPPEKDFANSVEVPRYPGSNSLGHLYVYIVRTTNFPDIVIWQSTEKRLRRDNTVGSCDSSRTSFAGRYRGRP